MSAPLLTLGHFSFLGLESPAQILLKSKQRLVVHRLGSGSTSIDSLGKDVEVISFSGIFTGTDAAIRIQMIENIRSQNQPVSLSWASRAVTVLIREFDLQYISNQWVPYKLSCLTVAAELQTIAFMEDILSSPPRQVADIAGLLIGTSMTPTADQTSALATLATLNFDVPPAAALQTVQAMASSISSQLQVLDPQAQGGPSDLSSPAPDLATSFLSVTAKASQQASLQLAYNRMLNISVSATSSSQQ
jgi:hypothetical protein